MPILQAAFPNVAEETLRKIVGPLDKFSATEAIARARKFSSTCRTSQATGQQSQGQDQAEDSRKLLEAFSQDTGPAADAIKNLLKEIEAGKDVKEAADSLVSRLPSLMPDDPAMAAILAEAMANEFVKEATHE